MQWLRSSCPVCANHWAHVIKSQDLHSIRDGLRGVSSYWTSLAALPEPPA